MSEKIKFQCDWIENAVRKCLNKYDSDIELNDMAKIKYLKIGESFENDFLIELSTSCPPDPFADTDGGDEWSEACLLSDNIKRFIKEQDEEDLQLSVFDCDYAEEWSYAYGEEAAEKWEKFKSTIISENYCMEFDNDDDYDNWYDTTASDFQKDIKYFKNVEVLRVYGGQFTSFKPLESLTQLRCAEFVETCFETSEKINVLSRLKQLCCWMD